MRFRVRGSFGAALWGQTRHSARSCANYSAKCHKSLDLGMSSYLRIPILIFCGAPIYQPLAVTKNATKFNPSSPQMSPRSCWTLACDGVLYLLKDTWMFKLDSRTRAMTKGPSEFGGSCRNFRFKLRLQHGNPTRRGDHAGTNWPVKQIPV